MKKKEGEKQRRRHKNANASRKEWKIPAESTPEWGYFLSASQTDARLKGLKKSYNWGEKGLCVVWLRHTHLCEEEQRGMIAELEEGSEGMSKLGALTERHRSEERVNELM